MRELIRYAEFIKKAYQDELTSQWLRLLNNRLNYANTTLKHKNTDKYKKCMDDILDALKEEILYYRLVEQTHKRQVIR